MVIDRTPFTVQQEDLPVLEWRSVCKYLGVTISSKGTTKWAGAQMKEALRKVSSAYLKPQQKLLQIRSYLVPKYLYSLQHQKVSVGTLRSLDRMLRAEVRKVLHLPGDTPVPMFHEHPGNGGRGVPELESTVLSLKGGMKEKLAARGGLWN